MKVRKKLVVVDAVLYQPGMEDGHAYYDLNGKFLGYYDKIGAYPKSNRKPAIKTLEGFHVISEGDYIITGVKGERYPIKPDIFKETYEITEDNGTQLKHPYLESEKEREVLENLSNYEQIESQSLDSLVDKLNSLSGVNVTSYGDKETLTYDCTGIKWKYHVYFRCKDQNTLAELGRALERNYSDQYKWWSLGVTWTDTEPFVIYYLQGTKEADIHSLIKIIETYQGSISELIDKAKQEVELADVVERDVPTEAVDMKTYNEMIKATRDANTEQAQVAKLQQDFLGKEKDRYTTKYDNLLNQVAVAIINGQVAGLIQTRSDFYFDERTCMSIWEESKKFVDARPEYRKENESDDITKSRMDTVMSYPKYETKEEDILETYRTALDFISRMGPYNGGVYDGVHRAPWFVYAKELACLVLGRPYKGNSPTPKELPEFFKAIDDFKNSIKNK